MPRPNQGLVTGPWCLWNQSARYRSGRFTQVKEVPLPLDDLLPVTQMESDVRATYSTLDSLTPWQPARLSADDLSAADSLRRSSLGSGLSPSELRYVVDSARRISVPDGTILAGPQVEPAFHVILRGRIRLHPGDSTSLHAGRLAGPGDFFGETVLVPTAAGEWAAAVDRADLLRWDSHSFDRLLRCVPGFAANLAREVIALYAESRLQSVRRVRPAVVGLVSMSRDGRRVARAVAACLKSHGESLDLLTGDAAGWNSSRHCLVERIPWSLSADDLRAIVRRRVAHGLSTQDRVLFDLTADDVDLHRWLVDCFDELVWMGDARAAQASIHRLAGLLSDRPSVAEKSAWVWVMRDEERFSPPAPDALGLSGPVFKVALADLSWTERSRRGIVRIARHLRRCRLGLALGGGSARGLAHLGVLRALDRAGVFFDLLAGTSSGALMGGSYAGNWHPQHALELFHHDLTPPSWVRLLPGGPRWYMLGMFRFGGWDRKLRVYLGDATLDQLEIPISTLSVDLVGGQQVVRDRGDAVKAILESINLPLFARPIVRDGMVLVDGGVLNHLPADVLPPRGADRIIGIDVAAPLTREAVHEGTSGGKVKLPGRLGMLWRVSKVQDQRLASMGQHSVDLLITPDTAGFDFADFTKAPALGDVGEAAAEQVLPEIRRLLERAQIKGIDPDGI